MWRCWRELPAGSLGAQVQGWRRRWLTGAVWDRRPRGVLQPWGQVGVLRALRPVRTQVAVGPLGPVRVQLPGRSVRADGKGGIVVVLPRWYCHASRGSLPRGPLRAGIAVGTRRAVGVREARRPVRAEVRGRRGVVPEDEDGHLRRGLSLRSLGADIWRELAEGALRTQVVGELSVGSLGAQVGRQLALRTLRAEVVGELSV